MTTVCRELARSSAFYSRSPQQQGLAEGFAFQKFHGDVGRAVVGLAGFVNGDDVVGVMNAAVYRGSRLILKAQQEVGIIQQLAVQDFERHRTVAHRDLLGEEDRTHAARSQLANEPETAGKARSEMGVDLSHSGKSLVVAEVSDRRTAVGDRRYRAVDQYFVPAALKVPEYTSRGVQEQLRATLP